MWASHQVHVGFPPSACGLPTKCMWASHQVHVGIPVIVIRQPGSFKAGASLLSNKGEGYQSWI
jgi:hypothetical protein